MPKLGIRTGVAKPKAPGKTLKVERGQGWEMRLGDSVEVLAGMSDGTIDMVFTDPPYGHNNNNGDLIHNWEAAIGRVTKAEKMSVESRPIDNDGPEADGLYRKCLPHLNRLMSRGGCCCCCCCGGGGPDPQFARWALWMDEVFEFKQMVVWDKGPIGMGWHYHRSYETVLVGQKKGGPCKWYDTTKRVENIIRPYKGRQGIPKIIPSKEQHPTEKPFQLAEHFIRLHTQRGETVLDPFAGRASTGVAALRLGRKFIGIEIDQHWFDESIKRLRKIEKGTKNAVATS